MSNELKAVVTADVAKFNTAMHSIGLSASGGASAVIAAVTAAAASVAGLEIASIKAAKSYETLRLRLQLLSGNMKEGAKEFEEIRKFAEGSAFATDEVIGAYIKLRAVAGQGFATENIENVAFASKIAGEGMEVMADRLGQLVLRIRSGLTGGLLAKSLRTFGTTFGEEATLELVKLAEAGEDSQVILEKVQEGLSRLGKEAQEGFGNSVEGLEKQIGGILTGGLANLGEGPLDTYRQILKEIIALSTEFGTENEVLAASMTDLLDSLLKLVQSEEFREFVKDGIALTIALVDAFTLLIDTINKLLPIYRKFADLSPAGILSNLVLPDGASFTAEEVKAELKRAREVRDGITKVKVITEEGSNAFQ